MLSLWSPMPPAQMSTVSQVGFFGRRLGVWDAGSLLRIYTREGIGEEVGLGRRIELQCRTDKASASPAGSCPAGAAQTQHSHLARSPGAGCPEQGMTSTWVGLCSEIHGGPPANCPPCSWAEKPSLTEGRHVQTTAQHSQVPARDGMGTSFQAVVSGHWEVDKDKRQVFIEPQCFDVMDGDFCFPCFAGSKHCFPLMRSSGFLPIYKGATHFPHLILQDFSRLFPPCQPLEGTAFTCP